MFENGLFIARNVFDEKEVEALREAFFDALDYCTESKRRRLALCKTLFIMSVSKPISRSIIKPNLNELICEFFEGKSMC